MSGRQFEPRDERGPVVHDFPLEVFPVVEAGAAEIVVVYAEAKGADEPQFCANGHAGSPDAAGVVRDLRLMEDDVQAGFVLHMVGITGGAGSVKR